MSSLSLRFYSSLNDFLPPEKRQVRFSHRPKQSSTVKDTIESLGVPHPEIDLILVNDRSVDFSYLVQAGDRISVFPRFQHLDISSVSRVQPAPLPEPRFVLDVHLGKLATYLRLLGFDIRYANHCDDATLAQIASDEQRILLTRDRGLLKRSLVTHGYCVRHDDPLEQVSEILSRFDLFDAIAPFERCLRCNGQLQPVEKAQVSDRLPPLTRQYYDEFYQCQSCQQVYWKGAHYAPLQQIVQQMTTLPSNS
ncbi:MAG: Mut7-C ubiquitin/RNAse domain-containing protein [Leptolyngbya sp. SIO4C5]|nr:Mut7-C ubiquitin/RNAse domain-containing protein [Leptolyngbya sp. SIO4C5]